MKTNLNKEYDITKQMLNRLNESPKKISLIKENENQNEDDAIAITDDAKFGEQVLTNQMSAFRQSVHGGAKFANAKPDNPKSSPLVFFPNTGNLIFSGSIPALSNLKFQFSLNDVTNAPYIFVDGLALTDETIKTLNKLNGFYKNWCEEWFAAGSLLEKLKKEEN